MTGQNFDLNAKLKEIEARARKEAEEAIRESELRTLLPSQLKIERVSGASCAYHADARLTLQPAETLEEAQAAMEALPPLPLVRVKGSFLSYVPESAIDENPDKFAREDCQRIAPFLLKHEQAAFNPIPRSVVWYTQVGPWRIHVVLPIIDPRLSQVILPTKRDAMGKYTPMAQCFARETLADRFWTSEPKQHASLVFYWRHGAGSTIGRLDWSRLTR